MKLLNILRKAIALDNPVRLFYHFCRGIIANIVYRFPSRGMIIIWVTWTNGKTTTTNLIAKALQQTWEKVFMLSTINYLIWDEEVVNMYKMSSPDHFVIQKLLSKAKKAGCKYAVIETTSHGLLMHRFLWIDYDVAVLTNISQDHLDLHKTMEKYVDAKLKLFTGLMMNRRKWDVQKTAIINSDTKYNEKFLELTYDGVYTFSTKQQASIVSENINYGLESTSFRAIFAGHKIDINTKLRWEFNVSNILAAIWVLISLWVTTELIKRSIESIDRISWRLEEVSNFEKIKIFVDYAHTEDALDNVFVTLKKIKGVNRIITVFWATWDRDRTKRPWMWKIVSENSDIVILTQDDDYSEKTMDIINEVRPWIERTEWEDFWIIPDREDALRTALLKAEKNDLLFVTWKGDEHLMITNDGPVEWHDKTVIKKLLKEMDESRSKSK